MSDIIMEKYTAKAKWCESYYEGPAGNLVLTRRETTLDPFHFMIFYNNRNELRGGSLWSENFARYSQTNYDWQSEVGLFDMSSGLPDPNMTGCS